MNGDEIGKNVMKALLVVLGVIGIIGALTITPYIQSIIVGTLFETGESSGVITNGSAIDNFTDTLVSNYTSNMGKVTTATGIGLNLLILAIVLIVLGGLVYGGYKGYQKMKGKKGGNMGI